ncbi:MAG: ABC transporter permease subunit [Pseudomonadota bacterium]
MTDATTTDIPANPSRSGPSDTEITSAFKEFADRDGDYYADTFLKLQQAKLGWTHINWQAAIGSFIWARLRGNWLLFWIAFVIDLLTAVHVALVFKYTWAKEQAIIDAKQNLIDRYADWTSSHLMWAIIVFVVGRLLFGMIADRLYFQQYTKWRVNRATPSGYVAGRIGLAILILALIAPLTIYRASQFAPSDRDCAKLQRTLDKGEEVSFKSRFDCTMIGNFPKLIQMDRRATVTFPRDENGNRIRLVTPAKEGAKPQTLSDWLAQGIEDGINHLTAFYGVFFDAITQFLRTLLNAIEAVFVGTPWIITMGVLMSVSYVMAGPRITIFVAATLAYLALMDYWQIAMQTMSLVASASLICVVGGLPLGVWMGKSKRVQSIVTPILDMMQTIPSFVYLLPAIAFFSIGKPPGIIATVIFAMPPMVRLTSLGVQHVPESTKEAALAFGANPRQLLTKVELPLALPSIMAGVNQVVMMSLSMVVVAGLIGAGGLGFIVTRALAEAKTGRGILAGIGIALIAMMIDRVVQKANQTKT